ncbi:cuticle protein AM1159-like [Panulirus ornatus]|uniref:cuticle protein AM1159-like n=1 Tax=Panulirus ornatus TaxID=150431 RepID=UPI003A835BF1
MQSVVFACLAAAVVAASQSTGPFNQQDEATAAIYRDTQETYGNGGFNYQFLTENGILVTVVGTPGFNDQGNMEGSYRFPFPGGTFAAVDFVADEKGDQPESPLLPTLTHPPATQSNILVGEEQRKQGITWD